MTACCHLQPAIWQSRASFRFIRFKRMEVMGVLFKTSIHAVYSHPFEVRYKGVVQNILTNNSLADPQLHQGHLAYQQPVRFPPRSQHYGRHRQGHRRLVKSQRPKAALHRDLLLLLESLRSGGPSASAHKASPSSPILAGIMARGLPYGTTCQSQLENGRTSK